MSDYTITDLVQIPVSSIKDMYTGQLFKVVRNDNYTSLYKKIIKPARVNNGDHEVFILDVLTDEIINEIDIKNDEYILYAVFKKAEVGPKDLKCAIDEALTDMEDSYYE